MGFFARLIERSRHARLQRFEPEEKRALVRLCHAVAAANGDLSDEEVKAAGDLARDLGVDANEANKLTLKEAIAALQAKPAHLELALLAVVDVIFADGAYDKGERAFVDSFSAKFGLPENTLKEAVERRAKQTVDAALEQWHHDIVSGKAGV